MSYCRNISSLKSMSHLEYLISLYPETYFPLMKNYHQQYRKDRRLARMEQLLPEDKRCPLCRRLKLSSKSWVLHPHRRNFRSKDQELAYERRLKTWRKLRLPKALCKSCFAKITSSAISASPERFYIWDGEALSKSVRNKTELAKRSGFSATYIRSICFKMSVRLDRETTSILAASLVQLGIRVRGLIKYYYDTNPEQEKNPRKEDVHLRDGRFELESDDVK